MHFSGRRSLKIISFATFSNLFLRVLPSGLSLAFIMLGGPIAAGAQTPITAGYRDFNYGSTVISTPTAEKPESKLWWNDGFWWASLWNAASNKYRIHRFEVATQSWNNVGPDLDDRPNSLADALWDGQKLYLASHVYGGGSQQSGNDTPANSARLYRYSYDDLNEVYSLDAGFPVLVNSAKSETLVLDKDATGQLWVTWTQDNHVYLNRSLGNDHTWGSPFALPVQGANLDGDDISTIIAFGGNKIGVMWSNQIDLKVYFAAHLDSKSDTDWELREEALADENLGGVADDHLNIKMMASNGDLYAVTKTSLSGSSAPLIYALRRTPSGVWTRHVVARGSDNYTRPIVILDEENHDLYIFASRSGAIRRKKVGLGNLSFPTGAGEAFILSASDDKINDPTAAKHNVNSTTGLLLLASDMDSRRYFHNYIALPGNGGAPTITSFTPASGPVGTSVMITGNNFGSVTNVAFNGIAAAGFTINSSTQITAIVPAGATTGKISVTKFTGTAVSANDFIVNSPMQYTLTVNAAGSGSVALDPSGGVYDGGTEVTLTATPAPGHQFIGWSGALTGSNNPVIIMMNANYNVTAAFAAMSGHVKHEETVTGGSSNSTTVTTSTSLSGVSGDLYLAAISVKSNVPVNSVSGLGLTWTLVKGQCAGRSQTRVEVWQAQGLPNSNGVVSATLASTVDNAVIAVSRYSGVAASNPIGNVVSGNTRGLAGSCSGGSDNNAYSFALTVSVNGAMVYGAAAMRSKSHAPGTEYTERAEIIHGSNAGNKASVATQDKSAASAGTTTVEGSFDDDVDWAVIGLEIMPQLNGGSTNQIVHEETQAGGSSDLTTVTTSANLTAADGHLYLAAISTRPKRKVNAVSGLGLSWTLVKAQCAGRGTTGIELWKAQGTPSGNQAVTATLESTPSNAVIAVSRYSGAHATHPLGNLISGNSNDLDGACTGGTDGNSYSFDLATTVNNALVYSAVAIRGVTHTPGTGYTERAEIKQAANGNAASVAVEDKTIASASSVAVEGALSGDMDWAVAAVVIKPQGTATTQYTLTVDTTGSGIVTFDPPGGIYDAGTVVTLTAIPDASYQFSGWSGDLSGTNNPKTITMGENKTVTATFTALSQIVHEETQTGGSSNSTAVTTSTSLVAADGHLYLAAISTRPKRNVTAVAGLGLSWTLVKAQCAGRGTTGIEIWKAQGTPGSIEVVTATLESAATNAVIAVSRYSGAHALNPIGNVISGNTNGSDGACTGGVDGNSYSLDLTTTAENALVYGAVAMRGVTHTPGAGYTERAEVKQAASSNAAAVAVEDKAISSASTVAIEGSLSGAMDWAMVAVEIKPQSAVGKQMTPFGERLTSPSAYQLEQNYPNPFNPETTINIVLPAAGKVTLKVYDETGQMVRSLVEGELAAGRHVLRWNGRNRLNRVVAAGIYFCRMVVQGEDGNTVFAQTRRMTLIK